MLSKFEFLKKLLFVLTILVFLGSTSFLFFNNFTNSRKVYGEKVSASPVSSDAVLDSPSSLPSPSPNPTPSPITRKMEYTIALFGDSMIDTMGEKLEYLQKSLDVRYPGVVFHLYNYGIGGQNVSEGLSRFDKSFSNRTRSYPPISKLNADIIILGSFAYNPFSPHNRDKHWITLTNLTKETQKTGASVYLLSEIAPLKLGFGKGTNGINWPEEMAHEHASHIVEQLENAVNLSKSLNIALINAFYESQVDGNWGNPNYVDGNDGIHPSVLGHKFMADLIATSIKL